MELIRPEINQYSVESNTDGKPLSRPGNPHPPPRCSRTAGRHKTGSAERLIIAVMGPRELDDHERGEWEAEFEAAARRPLRTRLRYAFIHTYKPVLDDAAYRSFDTMAQYRAWCARELPEWLGYGTAV